MATYSENGNLVSCDDAAELEDMSVADLAAAMAEHERRREYGIHLLP